MGSKMGQKWVKNGSKMVHFWTPFLTGPEPGPPCTQAKMGHFWPKGVKKGVQKWVKNGSFWGQKWPIFDPKMGQKWGHFWTPF